MRDLIGSDADTSVDNVDHQLIVISIDDAFRSQFHSSVLRKLGRVIEQLADHILELAGVAKGRSEIRRDRASELV